MQKARHFCSAFVAPKKGVRAPNSTCKGREKCRYFRCLKNVSHGGAGDGRRCPEVVRRCQQFMRRNAQYANSAGAKWGQIVFSVLPACQPGTPATKGGDIRG